MNHPQSEGRLKMRTSRKQKGSSVVEGVIGLWLVVAAIVLGTLFLVNAGVSTYCKEKERT